MAEATVENTSGSQVTQGIIKEDISPILDALRSTILSKYCDHVVIHFDMDALEEQAWQAQVFSKSNLLYSTASTWSIFQSSRYQLTFLKLKCLFGHVSFPRTLSERRMVVFPQCNRLLDKLKDVASPV